MRHLIFPLTEIFFKKKGKVFSATAGAGGLAAGGASVATGKGFFNPAHAEYRELLLDLAGLAFRAFDLCRTEDQHLEIIAAGDALILINRHD